MLNAGLSRGVDGVHPHSEVPCSLLLDLTSPSQTPTTRLPLNHFPWLRFGLHSPAGGILDQNALLILLLPAFCVKDNLGVRLNVALLLPAFERGGWLLWLYKYLISGRFVPGGPCFAPLSPCPRSSAVCRYHLAEAAVPGQENPAG